MKIKKILAAIAACAMAVSAMAVSASAVADNQKAYQFGGAQVTWNVDIDGDEVEDCIGGVGGDTWIGTLNSDGTGTLSIPVAQGDVVEIYCMSWDSLPDQVIFTATIDGTTYDCYYGKPVAYTVADDISELKIDIKWTITDGETDGYFNDWCGSGIIVTSGGVAAPVADETPVADTTTAPAATGNVPAAVMASVMAVAGAAVVASRKRK